MEWNGSSWSGTGHSKVGRVIVEWNGSSWSRMGHSGVGHNKYGPVPELTLVQAIQARPPRCWLHCIIQIRRKEFVTLPPFQGRCSTSELVSPGVSIPIIVLVKVPIVWEVSP